MKLTKSDSAQIRMRDLVKVRQRTADCTVTRKLNRTANTVKLYTVLEDIRTFSFLELL